MSVTLAPPTTRAVPQTSVWLGFVVVLMLHFSLVISRLTDQNKILAQRVALLERRLDAATARQPAGDDELDAPGIGASR